MATQVAARMTPTLSFTGIGLLLFVVPLLWRSNKAHRQQRNWERDRLRELETYCWLKVTLPVNGEPRILAEESKRVCRLVSEMSVFPKVAILLRNAHGELICAGSSGMDDLTLAALDTWGERLLREEGDGADGDTAPRNRAARKSFSIVLGDREDFDAMPGQGSYRATIVPLRTQRGRLAGVLAVCADAAAMLDTEQMQQAVAPLEVLAANLTRILEQDVLVERLMELERMAAAGDVSTVRDVA